MLATIFKAGIFKAGLALVALTPVVADGYLGEADIKAAFSGQTIDGVYADKTTFTETYSANGHTDYSEPKRKMAGHWSVIEGQFCTIYDEKAGGGCFLVKKVSANCYEFYFANPDEETAAEGDVGRPRWTARGWIKGKTTTCEDPGSV